MLKNAIFLRPNSRTKLLFNEEAVGLDGRQFVFVTLLAERRSRRHPEMPCHDKSGAREY